MSSAVKQDITRDFIRRKRPCADGFRWYLKRHEAVSNYQSLLDDLVSEGRIDDACWLMDQLGPTDDVLRVDDIDAHGLVFAGTVECRRGLSVDSIVRTGRSLIVGGGVRAGTLLQVGEDLRVSGAVVCDGAVKVTSDVRVAWSLQAGSSLSCGGHLRVGWDVQVAGRAQLGGNAWVGHGMAVGGELVGRAGLRTGADLVVTGMIDMAQGVTSGGAIRTDGHLQCGSGIRAAHDIVANGAIRAGETLQAGGRIQSGPDYGVFAGLLSPIDAWAQCGYVMASEKPARLLSGWWAGD